jgi:hypothetical protein
MRKNVSVPCKRFALFECDGYRTYRAESFDEAAQRFSEVCAKRMRSKFTRLTFVRYVDETRLFIVTLENNSTVHLEITRKPYMIRVLVK